MLEIKTITQFNEHDTLRANDAFSRGSVDREVGLFRDSLQESAFTALVNSADRNEGSAALSQKIKVIAQGAGVSISPEEIVGKLVQNELIMKIVSQMWDQVMEGRALHSYPFVLAILMANMPLDVMSNDLRQKIEKLPVSYYAVSPFAPVTYCEMAENYMYEAVSHNQVGTDGFTFLTKASGAKHVGMVGSVSTLPVRTISASGREGIIVPYVWYSFADHIVRDSVKQQVIQHGSYSVPDASLQVMRQFDARNCSDMKSDQYHMSTIRNTFLQNQAVLFNG